MPIRNIAGAISGTNTRLKYGGPTESLPMPSASTIRRIKRPEQHGAGCDRQQHVVR